MSLLFEREELDPMNDVGTKHHYTWAFNRTVEDIVRAEKIAMIEADFDSCL